MPTRNSRGVRRVDAALFERGPWQLIDAQNRGVGRARTVDEAEAAVSAGRAATFAGTVRPYVMAIDLDLDS